MNVRTNNIFLRTLCLLLMAVGAGKAWGQVTVETTPAYYYSDNTGGTWESGNTGRYTVSQADDSNDGGYVNIAPVDNGNNGTRVWTKSTNVVSAGISYVLEFDMWLKGGNGANAQASWFQVNDAQDISINTNASLERLSSSVLHLAQKTAGGDVWVVNNSADEVTLDTNYWYHFRLIRTSDKTYLTITSNSGATTDFNAQITTCSTVGGLGGMEFATKRYSAGLSIDNLKVMKLGWVVSAFAANLATTNDNNKPTEALLPSTLYKPSTLFDATGAVVQYTYDNAVLQNSWDSPNYPPRLKTTGVGTVTATFVKAEESSPALPFDGITSVYTMNVTSPVGGGSYDASTNTYTFTTIGTLSARTIEDVQGLTMSFRGGPTAVVVERNSMKVLKVIDGNGYTLPNLGSASRVIPPENNWGGTYYKFVPSIGGTLTITGQFDTHPRMYKSDGTEEMLNTVGETRTAKLVAGETYYLYNTYMNGETITGSNIPMLHSFSYEQSNTTGLVFRNPQPVITVDVTDGSYSNPAVSAAGLPVNYRIVAGGSYATVDGGGTVHFNSGLYAPPYSVTIEASTAAAGGYAAAAISYTINLVKRTWIFDDNSKWTTTESELTNWEGPYNYTTNGLNGTSFKREVHAINYAELTKDGTNVLPETKGLLFSKVANDDRLYIAPNGYSPNFLATRATTIAIDDVEAGQTVTVDWYGGNSSAVLDLSDVAGENVRGTKRGPTLLTVTQTGRVSIISNPIVSYIRSIKVSSPTRTIGTLSYARTVLTASATEALADYTITDETGTTDLTDAYGPLTNFKSTNTDAVTVNSTTGQITAVATGVAVITATATALNPSVHQATVTVRATVEVVGSASTRIRTISMADLLYTTTGSGSDYNRTIPGFTLAYTDGVSCSSTASVTLSGSDGKLVITPRARTGETITIEKAIFTVKSATSSPQWKFNGGSAEAVSAGAIIKEGLSSSNLSLEVTTGSVELTDIRIYYHCSNADNADYCLDDTKVAPVLSFITGHIMRIPDDGKLFTQSPTLSSPLAFNATFTYASSATAVATVNADGTGGQLHKAGEAVIIATFNETKYFAQATAQYTVNNTLLPGEQYDGISIVNGQFIHVTASASADGSDLTLVPTGPTLNKTVLTYGTTQARKNTSAEGGGSSGTIALANNTVNRSITVYSVMVVTPNVKAWLYYEGQEENYAEQVQFTGFSSGPVKGFRVIDIGDPNNIVELTDAYSLKEGKDYTLTSSTISSSVNAATGEVSSSANAGTAQLEHLLTKKEGAADGYEDEIPAGSLINVLAFNSTTPVTWNFKNQVDKNTNVLGQGWTYNSTNNSPEEGYWYGYFSDFMPILTDYTNSAKLGNNGILLKDEFRYYTYDNIGLRVNLSKTNSKVKFPVKAGMEIDIEVADASADITHLMSNVTNISGSAASGMYIKEEGRNNATHAYFLAKEDGCVIISAMDRVGMYLKSITLQVPKIHFDEEIVTVLTSGDNSTGYVTNTPYNVSLSNLTYTFDHNYTSFDTDGNTEAKTDGTDTSVDFASFETTADTHSGKIKLEGTKEGWVTVNVANTNPALGPLEPRSGSYKLYVVDFRFDPSAASLNLDDNVNKEMGFDRRPVGINKVATPINYSFEVPEGSNARAMISQTTNTNPALTAYQLTVYNKGTLNVIAQTGRITAQCALTVTGHTFEKVVDVLSESDIADNDYIYTINLPDYYNADNSAQWSLAWAYEGEFPQTPDVTLDLTIPDGLTGDARAAYPGKLKIKDLYGTSATKRNHGAIRFIATYNDGVNGDKYTQFVLTLSYPASSGKKWDFFRSATGLKAQADHDDKINDYVGTHLNEQSVSSYTITGTGETGTGTHWTTDASWNKIYRNGDKEPRWAYGGSVKCDNAFIIEETAGLLIETSPNSFYVDNNATAAYCHVGIHSHGKVTIPSLKAGDFVSLNLSRVIPNSGAILKATNVKDLRGMPVTESFTITRSQIDKPDKPGYYTFQVMNDGDVSFTLEDEGYLDILSVEIYNGTYRHTLKDVKLSQSPDYPTAPMYILKESAEEDSLTLAFCHPMGSTSVGPAEYVLKGINPDEVGQNLASYEMKYYVDDETQATLDREHQNLTIGLEKDPWQSPGGVWYENGKLRIGRGYGKITVRMNNYTAEGRYLIGYSPDYTLTVGHKPHQTYPYTWDFTNISGGESKNRRNNADSSVANDETTWVERDDNVYELNTNTNGGSLYVPGATLVTLDRDLGEDGTKDYLDSEDHGVDEFNGLGISGWLMFKGEATGVSAKRRAPRRAAAAVGTVELLSYKMSDLNYNYQQELTAGNGTIFFGANKRTALAEANCGYGYQCDGDKGSTKYIRLTPMRPFKAGDIISVKACTKLATPAGITLFASNEALADSVYCTLSRTDSEKTLSYTVLADDAIEGKSSIYLYRYWADREPRGTTVYVSEVSITGNYYAPEVRTLYVVAPTTITIPDLNADGKQDWIYIHASRAPLSITNATDAVAADGLDAKDEHVYKYKVTAAGNSDVTFAGDAEIYKIGVTHILKDIAEVGGKGWATESRDHSIDHSLTGYFTVNDVNAYGVVAADYGDNVTKVSLVPIAEDGYVPENTGIVLKLDATTNLSLANGGKKVPLFYPSYTAAQTTTVLTFPDNNLMRPNVTERLFTNERENADGTEADDADYYRFILAKRYMTWKKQDGILNTPTDFEEKDAAVFYRMHYYTTDADGKTANQLNTLGANKAYLLLPADKLPAPLWEEPVAPAPQRYIGIVGESDMADDILSIQADAPTFGDGKTYNLRGQLVTDDGRLPSGIYIRNGRKVVIK